jgi:predicted DNA-binding protein YlxM (UPF0122 family)
MTSREEREKKVLELHYEQEKGIRDIAKELHLSFSTINDIIKRDRQQKEKEKENQIERERNNNNIIINDDYNGNGKVVEWQQQQHHQIIPATSSSLSLPSLSVTDLEELTDKQKAAIAYKLYDQGKTPVQVSGTLCLTARETMQYHREFLRLKGYHKLYQIYPEIEQSLPSFLKLFKGLKKHGLNPQNVEWYVDAMNIGLKLEDLSPDYENLQSENENLYNQHENLKYSYFQLERNIQSQTKDFEVKKKAMRDEISSLAYTRNELRRTVDITTAYITELLNKKVSLEEFVYRFRKTDPRYTRIKNVAEEHIKKLLSQTDQNQKAILNLALCSVLQALRENPNRYNVIFDINNNNNNSDNNSNNTAYHVEATLSMAQNMYDNLLRQSLTQTMNTLESQADADVDIESDVVTEEEAEVEDTVAAEAKAK